MEEFKIQPGRNGKDNVHWRAGKAVPGPKISGQYRRDSSALLTRQHVETTPATLGPQDYEDSDMASMGPAGYALYPLTDDVIAQARQRIEDLEIAVTLATEMRTRTIDELLRHSVVQTDDLEAIRDQLFKMYRQGLITKADVRRRGELDPAEFHEEMHRLSRETRAVEG